MKIPSFRDLIDVWIEEFNTSHNDIEVKFDDFTGLYTCIEVGKKGAEKHECCAHLFTEKSKYGNCIEIESVRIRAEDPSLFDHLVARVEKKASELA